MSRLSIEGTEDSPAIILDAEANCFTNTLWTS
jgi:hypothetical protein